MMFFDDKPRLRHQSVLVFSYTANSRRIPKLGLSRLLISLTEMMSRIERDGSSFCLLLHDCAAPVNPILFNGVTPSRRM